VTTTSIDTDTAKRLAQRITDIPAGFTLHPTVNRIIENRRKMSTGELPMDWGFAETMAYASLVDSGHPIRLSGQDCGRGTFFHRHAVLHDHETGATHLPLRHISDTQADFLVINSTLSEEAVLAYEYGYSSAEPNSLVIWEAQFGDFANGAQVVFDQFISSSEAKWKRYCGLVTFLPHGYDGQGPEHSSARGINADVAHRVPVIVECLTDNANRTAGNMRVLFRAGQLGAEGSVSWDFDYLGVIEATKKRPSALSTPACRAAQPASTM